MQFCIHYILILISINNILFAYLMDYKAKALLTPSILLHLQYVMYSLIRLRITSSPLVWQRPWNKNKLQQVNSAFTSLHIHSIDMRSLQPIWSASWLQQIRCSRRWRQTAGGCKDQKKRRKRATSRGHSVNYTNFFDTAANLTQQMMHSSLQYCRMSPRL